MSQCSSESHLGPTADCAAPRLSHTAGGHLYSVATAQSVKNSRDCLPGHSTHTGIEHPAVRRCTVRSLPIQVNLQAASDTGIVSRVSDGFHRKSVFSQQCAQVTD